MDGLADGIIRVGRSYGGPLKEDKTGAGRSKWVPAPIDAEKALGPWLEKGRRGRRWTVRPGVRLHGSQASEPQASIVVGGFSQSTSRGVVRSTPSRSRA